LLVYLVAALLNPEDFS
ncbi:MAG: K(+)-transporting ATPase subunit F, partial [Anaerolineales bacterium]|nr:K(+)-transporting ATPase subunit F [Anaerolineales bacterium]